MYAEFHASGFTRWLPISTAMIGFAVSKACFAFAGLATTGTAAPLEVSMASGANYGKADYRLWLPPEVDRVRAVLVLMPGSNDDGRPQAHNAVWQAFAIKNKLALLGCRLTDKPHDRGFIEQYADVSKGSGQTVLDALTAFAAQTHHPELATAPLLLWGMSAGGEFNYEFAAWKPERVAAFIVNKGGIYYTALLSPAACHVPGLLFIGGKDMKLRTDVILGLFALNRRVGALWALPEEPGAGHWEGHSPEISRIFFEDVLALRLAPDGSLKAIPENTGFIGDPLTKEFLPIAQSKPADHPTSWLPTLRVAQAWQALVNEKPFP